MTLEKNEAIELLKKGSRVSHIDMYHEDPSEFLEGEKGMEIIQTLVSTSFQKGWFEYFSTNDPSPAPKDNIKYLEGLTPKEWEDFDKHFEDGKDAAQGEEDYLSTLRKVGSFAASTLITSPRI